jgi:DNA ligase (NAD+)
MIQETMLELIQQLNYYRNEYYNNSNSIISDRDYDILYDKLVKMEQTSGIILSNSPSQTVGYPILNSLEKTTHSHPMLSLDKTKDINELKKFIGDKESVLSLKLDGLTVLLTYENGKLIKGETRGNGIEGQLISEAVKHFQNIPLSIPYKDFFEVEGEALILYKDFKEVNKSSSYKNPRNLASGSLSLLDMKELEARKLSFIAWKIPSNIGDTYSQRFEKAKEFGFTVVPYFIINNLEENISQLEEIAKEKQIPIDGLVASYNDIAYGLSLGNTSHAPKHSYAFKLYDEEYETKLTNIDWGLGRTGIITPVAEFLTVDIDGSEVSRASLHNLSVMEETLGKPYEGQKLWVSKRNMIIPCVERAEKEPNCKVEYFEIPKVCPVCGQPVEIQESDAGVKNLVCVNPQCDGLLINRLDHMFGKKGLEVRGLSIQTLQKLIDWGWVEKPSDVFNLSQYKSEWVTKSGFGVKSVENILAAIEKGKDCELWQFISSLGIPLIGSTYAKEIAKREETWFNFREAMYTNFDFSSWNGFGYEMNNALYNFDYTEADMIYNKILNNVSNSLWVDPSKKAEKGSLNGVNIVITGKLGVFKNRAELQQAIENKGGKVVGSVSRNTNYLINNDNTSTSAKNLSAQKLNIPIITEEQFIAQFLT